MAKIVTLGEIMLRLSTPGFQKIIRANGFDACYGGGEANVAASLANYGYDVEFVTKLPENQLGDAVCATLRSLDVGTRHILRGGERLGIYFLETGASVRASNVIYDRKDSSFACAKAEEFDFDSIMSGASLFCFSGITAALSENTAALAKAACEAAKRNGAMVACDYNYRQKLWTREEAAKTMTSYMDYVDIFFGGIDDACGLLGRSKAETDIPENVFAELSEKFDIKYVFATGRESHSASDNTLSACAYFADEKKLYQSKKYRVSPIIDRVGGGDAFTGGALCGILDGKNPQDILEFGVSASALKHTVPGDINLVSREEVEALAGGDGSGKVKR